MKPQLPDTCPECMYIHNEYIYDTNAQEVYCASCGEPLYKSGISYKAPYQPGDTLYVRETWNTNPLYDYGNESNKYVYKADYDGHAGEFGWRPSIHMPKEAARIWLKVTDMRVERLQEISPKECIREGIEPEALKEVSGEFARGMFNDLWDSTIKKSDLARYGWDANPWVWVIEFERCEKLEEIHK